MAAEGSARSAPDVQPHEAGPPARPAFYALRPGGWRDYWTLLHPPYTVWHLSYVALGAAAAPRFNSVRLAATIVGFFLGVGLSAHALDEVATRPLGTAISDLALKAIAGVSLAAAVALGVAGAIEVSWWLLAFVAFGAFIVVAYNVELFGGRFHSDAWFALAWGAFPALTGYFAQNGTLGWPAGLVAGACLLLSAAQRTLSTPVRHLRRHVAAIDGRMTLRDGTEVDLDDRALRVAPESALRTLAAALVLLSAGLVAARMLTA